MEPLRPKQIVLDVMSAKSGLKSAQSPEDPISEKRRIYIKRSTAMVQPDDAHSGWSRVQRLRRSMAMAAEVNHKAFMRRVREATENNVELSRTSSEGAQVGVSEMLVEVGALAVIGSGIRDREVQLESSSVATGAAGEKRPLLAVSEESESDSMS